MLKQMHHTYSWHTIRNSQVETTTHSLKDDGQSSAAKGMRGAHAVLWTNLKNLC